MGSHPQLFTMFKVFINVSFLLAAALAIPAGPPAYGSPAPYAEEKLPPKPYAYEYGVADDYSKANFKKSETQDANGLSLDHSRSPCQTAGSRRPPTRRTMSTGSWRR